MRRFELASVVLVAASTAGASARPLGFPVELAESFDRFTPGVALSQQGVSVGCPTWRGAWVPTLRAGSLFDVQMERVPTLPSSSLLETTLWSRVYAEGTVDAVIRSEVHVSGLTALSNIRITGGLPASATFNVLWGSVLPHLPCSGPVVPPAPASTFYVSGPCPGGAIEMFNTQVLVPLNAWFRVEMRTSSDGFVVWTVDRMDGSGPVELHSSAVPVMAGVLTDIRFDQSSAPAGEGMLVDNVRISGMSTRRTCPGDANDDGVVNFSDLNEVLNSYGQVVSGNWIAGDIDGDGVVGFADLNVLLSTFGATCGCRP